MILRLLLFVVLSLMAFFLIDPSSTQALPASRTVAIPTPTAVVEETPPCEGSRQIGCCAFNQLEKRCAWNEIKKRLECTGDYSKETKVFNLGGNCVEGVQCTTRSEISDDCLSQLKNQPPVGSCGDGRHEKGDLCKINSMPIFDASRFCSTHDNTHPSGRGCLPSTPTAAAVPTQELPQSFE